MPSATFRFGPAEEHECRMEFSRFGHERYFVDDTLVHEIQSLQMNGEREFRACGHDIRIEARVGSAGTVIRAIVDGQVVNEDVWRKHTRLLRFLASPSGRRLFVFVSLMVFFAAMIISFFNR